MDDVVLKRDGEFLTFGLPESVSDRLGLREGDKLSVTLCSDGSLRVDRAETELERDRRIVDDIMDRYADTLAELAK